jgi:hypothetical protein
MTNQLDLESLRRRQEKGLWLSGHNGIHDPAGAARFLEAVGFALRYNATTGLPLAAMYSAVWDPRPVTGNGPGGCAAPEDESDAQRRGIELANGLLGSGQAIEVSVIAGRVVLAHRKIVPALYLLRRRGRPPDDLKGLSLAAARAWSLILERGRLTAGALRADLGIKGRPNPDPTYEALAELQREMLVDRGPTDVPKEGIPYLSKEGIPYRPLHMTHKDIVRDARAMSVAQAAESVILTYLEAAIFVTPRKLASMFKLLMTREEIDAALERLEAAHRLRIVGSWAVRSGRRAAP